MDAYFTVWFFVWVGIISNAWPMRRSIPLCDWLIGTVLCLISFSLPYLGD